MEPDDFGSLFTSFRRSAFRLEARDTYAVDVEAEPLRRYLAGQPLPPTRTNEWTALVAEATASGKSIERVHVVSRPLTPYLRYEFEWGYAYSWDAGERISILEHPDPASLFGHLPQDDFWLFDDHLVVAMTYDDAGRFHAATVVEDRSAINLHRQSRDRALHTSTPFPDYLARLRNDPAAP